MKITKDSNQNGFFIELGGDELAMAIVDWLRTRGVIITGPRTVRANDERCESASVYVDPSGQVTLFQPKTTS